MAATPTSVRARPLHEDPRIYARRWFLLAMMCLALVVVVMSVSGLVTAIPTLQEELNASASQVQWILDAYAVRRVIAVEMRASSSRVCAASPGSSDRRVSCSRLSLELELRSRSRQACRRTATPAL